MPCLFSDHYGRPGAMLLSWMRFSFGGASEFITVARAATAPVLPQDAGSVNARRTLLRSAAGSVSSISSALLPDAMPFCISANIFLSKRFSNMSNVKLAAVVARFKRHGNP